MTATRPLLARLRAEDPGSRRGRFAGRCTLSLVLAMLLGTLAAHLGHGPQAVVALMAGTIGLFSAMLMQDPRPKVNLFMAGMILPVAFLGSAGAALLAEHPHERQFGLLLVMVGATWVQRYGPLAMAIGLTAFISWFYAVLAGAQPAHWAWMAVACLAAVVSALMVRMLILPERPARDMERLRQGFTARLARLLEALGQGAPPDVLVQRQAELDETALALERLLQHPAALPHPEAAAALLRRIFHTELAVEGLLRALRTDPAQAREIQRAAAVWAADLLADRPPGPVEGLAGEALQRLAAVLRPETHAEAPATAPAPAPPPPPAPPPAKGTALQVGVAGALALLVGRVLSPSDWQFAVFAAYLVFADSAFGTVRNALDRVVGTALGLVTGLVLGHLLSGRSFLEIALILACVYVALWFMPASQRITVFLFAVMTSVLFGMAGTLTTHLLWIRLAETTVGALAGGAVAALLVPRRLRPALDGAIADFLERVEALLAGAAAGSPTHGLVRAMDVAYHRVRLTARPGLAGFVGSVPEPLRRDLLALASVRDAARLIATRPGLTAEAVEPMRKEAASLREWLHGGPTTQEQELQVRSAALARLDEEMWAVAEG